LRPASRSASVCSRATTRRRLSTARACPAPRRTRASRPPRPRSRPRSRCAGSRATPRTPRPRPDHEGLGWSLVKTFESLFAELSEKARTRPADSGTVKALDAGVHAIGKKVLEEAAEAWMAAEFQSDEETAEEIAQLLYHAQVLMLSRGLTLDDVYRYLCAPPCFELPSPTRGPCPNPPSRCSARPGTASVATRASSCFPTPRTGSSSSSCVPGTSRCTSAPARSTSASRV